MVTYLRYADDTTQLAGTKEDFIELVGRVRRASEKAGLLTYPTLAGRHRRMHAKTRTCGIQVLGNTGDPGCWGRYLASL